jgi:phage gpG-like protein
VIKVELNGYKELSRKLGRLAGEFEREVDAEVEDVAKHFVSDAVHSAVEQGIFDTGRLVGAIRQEKVAPMAYNVITAVHYAAYHEWGTITHVRVPAGLESYAAMFKGRGIKKTGGIYPRPFFFIQMPKAQERMRDIPQTVYKRLVA